MTGKPEPRYKFLTLDYADANGPWFDTAFTEPAVRRAAAAKNRTLPGNITIDVQRLDSGWKVTIWEVQDIELL